MPGALGKEECLAWETPSEGQPSLSLSLSLSPSLLLPPSLSLPLSCLLASSHLSPPFLPFTLFLPLSLQTQITTSFSFPPSLPPSLPFPPSLSPSLPLPSSPSPRSHDAPMLVEGLSGKNVVSLAAGGAHSAAITEGGALYTWGRGSYGRLGHGEGGREGGGAITVEQIIHCTC